MTGPDYARAAKAHLTEDRTAVNKPDEQEEQCHEHGCCKDDPQAGNLQTSELIYLLVQIYTCFVFQVRCHRGGVQLGTSTALGFVIRRHAHMYEFIHVGFLLGV